MIYVYSGESDIVLGTPHRNYGTPKKTVRITLLSILRLHKADIQIKFEGKLVFR